MAYITGTAKYERIYGTYQDDTIDSKGGSDLIYDRANSNDTYIFNYGYGQPTYTDSGGNDTIEFGAGIKASDIKFYITNGGYLMPRIHDTTDKPEIAFWNNPSYKIEKWVFQDGTVLTSDDVDKLIDHNTRVLVYSTGSDTVKLGQGNNLIYLMQGDDTFTSSGGNNIIEASSGNDKIYNYGNGNDEIYMSTGVDTTEDRGGNDRYIYNKGDGQDTILDLNGNDVIKFGLSVVKSNVGFTTAGDNLVINFANTSSDKLIITDWLKSPNDRIETLEFWDGSKITSSEINVKIGLGGSSPSDVVPTIVGTNSGEYSGGNYTDDVYYLKQGNDKIMDYFGNDTYLFNIGDGQDTVKDQQGIDKIIFGQDIDKQDISFSVVDNNLILNNNETNDSVRIIDWFRSSAYQIETVQFADGSHYTSGEINTIVSDLAVHS